MEDGGDLVRRTGRGLPGEGMAELRPDRWPRAGSKVEWELMGTQDQEGIPRREKGIWKGPGARGHVTHLRTWGKASGAGLKHSMSLTLESCGLYPSGSHWEIVSWAATGWELGLKDCSSVWAGKRPRGWGEMRTPSDSAGGGFFKYDQEERTGTQRGDQNLFWATQYPTWRRSLVSPRMRQSCSLETRGACHKPQEEEERELGTVPQVPDSTRGRNGIGGKLMGRPFFHHQTVSKTCCLSLKVSFWGMTANIHFTLSQLLEEFKFSILKKTKKTKKQQQLK